jgi:hypothetical protein
MLGASAKSANPTKQTDYVVVGSKGSDQWAYFGLGRKVEHALKLKGESCKLRIIREEDFIHALSLIEKTFPDHLAANAKNSIPTFEKYVPKPEETPKLLLTGKAFVITGILSQDRDYFKDLIEQNGGKVSGSVSKNTDYLLAGESAGSKLDKATQLGVRILDEQALSDLLEHRL